jgi:hypothetical protein
MTDSQRSVAVSGERTLAEAHLDLGLGNTYRLEYIKHLVSIASGIFVFSVTFMKDLVGKPPNEVAGTPLLAFGWTSLVLSIVCGVIHMRCWASYYISWGLHYEDRPARTRRAQVNRMRRIAEYGQVVGFAVGLLFLLAFAIRNVVL